MHVMADLQGITTCDLNDERKMTKLVMRALKETKATLLGKLSYQFSPVGLTILVMLSESHASMHTYPEYESAFIDIFTCGNQCSPELFVHYLINYLQPTKTKLWNIRRGE